MKIPNGIIQLTDFDCKIVTNHLITYCDQFEHLYFTLKSYKDKIDNIDTKKWDKIKKNNNPYELLHISSNKYHQSISKYRPISRSYFKLIELVYDYRLLPDDNPLTIAFVSEGPGGFIESILNYRKHIVDKLYGITLNTYTKHIPGWKRLNDILNKYYINKKHNIKLIYGNIYLLDDIDNYCNYFINNKADLVTSDGGFDYSINFNNQEQLSYRILLAEIVIALKIQKIGGSFICKCFDLLTTLSLKYIYILYCFYDDVHIYKPFTSRPANSEKYIIAKGFKGISDNILQKLYIVLRDWSEYETGNLIITDLFDFEIPCEFISVMYDYNNESIQTQISYINNTLHMISNKPEIDIFKAIVDIQVSKSIDWCNKYNIVINTNSRYIKNDLNLKNNISS
jgi:23S rRNA U2552 (ribose-2'-O)-methylase RlmE/FtsJ